MQGKKRRKSYIVKQNFQLRYVGIMVFLILAATILVGINIYYQMGRLVMENSQVSGVTSFLKSVNLTLGIWISFIIILIAFFGIFLSHRIAGPLKSLENSMARVSKGDFSKYAKIRKGDEFQELIDVFNKMVIDLRQIVLEDRSIAKDIIKKLEYCSGQLDKDHLTKEQIHKLKEELDKLNLLIKKFTIEFKI